jgi:RimJ/RimL family protein N-acetyltransferase
VSASAFTLRRMEPADKPAMLSIASRIWEGTDYLPAAFDEWVEDRQGEFAAVLLDGRVVGCGKLTFLTDTDAWLEGLRKDPGVSEQGLGSAVVDYLLSRLAGRTDLASVRFATYVKNRASIVTNERAGFHVRTVLSVKAWEGSRVELLGRVSRERVARLPSRRQAAVVREERAIHDFLERHRYFEETQGLMVEGWTARPWSLPRFLERYAPSGACRGVYGRGGLEGLAAWTIVRRPDRTAARLVCLDAEDDDAAGTLLDDAFRGLSESSAGGPEGSTMYELEWMVPPGDRFRRWAAGRGLASWEQENDFLVFELPREELARRTAPRNRAEGDRG